MEIIDILISMISAKGAVVVSSSDSPFQKRCDRFTMNLYLYYFLVWSVTLTISSFWICKQKFSSHFNGKNWKKWFSWD